MIESSDVILQQVLEEHGARDADIPWHCKCNNALGGHQLSEEQLMANHRAHLSAVMFESAVV